MIESCANIGLLAGPICPGVTGYDTKVPHELFELTALNKNAGGPRSVGAMVAQVPMVATERDPPLRLALSWKPLMPLAGVRDEGVPTPVRWSRRATAALLKTVISRESAA